MAGPSPSLAPDRSFFSPRKAAGPCPLRALLAAKPVLPGRLTASRSLMPARAASGLSPLRADHLSASPARRPAAATHARPPTVLHAGLPRAAVFSSRADLAASTG